MIDRMMQIKINMTAITIITIIKIKILNKKYEANVKDRIC
jgi:hypothetical protein